MSNALKVQYVHIIPSDKTDGANGAITTVARHHHAWYRYALGSGNAFTLADPILVQYSSEKPSTWFSTNPVNDAQMYWFWDNVNAEMATLGIDWTAEVSLMVYIDAPTAYGQIAGGTTFNGTSGVAILPQFDIDGIFPTIQCSRVGGQAHELGHTFGLAHPVGDPLWNQALMGAGYAIYPGSLILPAEKDQLNANPFFSATPLIWPPPGLCAFPLHPPRPPRPRPPGPLPRPQP